MYMYIRNKTRTHSLWRYIVVTCITVW